MALQRTKATVPLTRGLAEHVDPRIVPAAGDGAHLLEAKNIRFDKLGSIAKRQGFTEVTNLDTEGDPLPFGCRGLFSTGLELCIVAERQLYSYVEPHDRWYNRGQVGPGNSSTREIYHGEHSFTCGDLDTEDGYLLYVARSVQTVELLGAANEYAPANQQVSIVQSVQTTGGVSVIPPTEYQVEPGDDPVAPHAPRACSTSGKLFGLWLGGTATPANLYRSDYLTSTPATAPATPVLMFNDVYVDGVNRRTYDAIQLAGGWLLAYIRDDNFVVVTRYDSAHVQQAQIVIAGPWYRVAVADSPTLNQVYLLLAKDNGAGTDELFWYALDRTTLAVNTSNVLLPLTTADDEVMNLGLVEKSPYVHSIWDYQRGNNIRQTIVNHARILNTGGVAVARPAVFNATVRSRPFVHSGRVYCWLETAVAGVDLEIETVQFFEAAFMVDLRIEDEGDDFFADRFPFLAGVHSVGAILPHGNIINAGLEPRQFARQCGSAGTVADIGSGEYRYASTRLARSEQDVQPRLSMEEVELRFGESPIAAVVHDGAVVISGSFFSWFAGSQTEELSFVTPPVIEVKTTGVPQYPADEAFAGTLPFAVYSYQALWESADPRGNMHRSLPSNVVQWNHDSLDAVRLAVRTCPASLRFPRVSVGRESTSIMHRAATGAVFRRITRPVDLRANVPNAHLTTTHVDYGQLYDVASADGTGTPIYITGGAELEASCPNGGQIATKVGDRVWLAIGDTVQYSKELTPRTATEDVLAPEFNELWAFVGPSGKPITGIGDLDGKPVVFTSDEIYVISGRGPDAANNANDFSGLTLVSTDTGCRSARSVVATPFGLIFAGTAGFYLLDRTLQLAFIGAAVEDTLRAYPYVTSAVLVAERHRTEVRFTCNLTPPSSGGDQGVILVWHYESKQWSTWEVTTTGPLTPFIDATMHQGTYYALTHSGRVYQENETTWYDVRDQWVTMSVSTAHFQPAGQSGWARYWAAMLLQEAKDPHDLTIEVYSGFEDSPSQTHTWSAADLASFPGYPLRQQPRIGIRRQKAQAQRVRWYDSEAATSTTGEGYTMAGLVFEFGVKPGLTRVSKQQRS